MSLPTMASAIETMRLIFMTAWKNADTTVTDNVELFFDVVSRQPSPDKPQIKMFIRHSFGRQLTFGGVGQRRFERAGTLTFQVLAPLSLGFAAEQKCVEMTLLIRAAYEGVGTQDGILFRNVRIQQIGSDGLACQFNVVVEFSYDELV